MMRASDRAVEANGPRRARSPAIYIALLAFTVVLGLSSRRFGGQLPSFVALYAGDTLWASMIVWCVALILRRARTRQIACVALAICIAVELSQLYRAPWLNALRDTTFGALVLGQGFLWSDLWCYTLGVLLAALIDRIVRD